MSRKRKIDVHSSQIHSYPDGTMIAFDENISDKTMGAYARSGCIIVYVAKEAEPDEQWVDKAIANGAEVIISHDLDIPNYLQKLGSNIEWREP